MDRDKRIDKSLYLTATGFFCFAWLLFFWKMSNDFRPPVARMTHADQMTLFWLFCGAFGLAVMLECAYLVRQFLPAKPGQSMIARKVYQLALFAVLIVFGAFIEASCCLGRAWVDH